MQYSDIQSFQDQSKGAALNEQRTDYSFIAGKLGVDNLSFWHYFTAWRNYELELALRLHRQTGFSALLPWHAAGDLFCARDSADFNQYSDIDIVRR